MGLAFAVAKDGVADEGERMSRRGNRMTIATLTVLLLHLGIGPTPARADGLTDVEFRGYLAWLQSVLGHASTNEHPNAGGRLYPFDLVGDDGAEFAVVVAADGHGGHGGHGGGDPDADILIVAGRGLIDLEHELRRPRSRRELSSREALRVARQYRHAAEYDSALAWYDRAGALDVTGELQTQIARESLATAVAHGDSAVVARQVLASLAGEPGAEETVIALRYLIAHRDDSSLARLAAATAGRAPHDPTLAVWLAYAHSTLGDWPTCLTELRALLALGGPDADLSAPLQAWVLVAVPDMLFLAGDHEGAGALYRALAASEIPGVATWARLQVANLDLLGGRHADASTAFAALCNDEAAAPWRAFACEMAEQSEHLTRYGAEAKANVIASDDDH